MTEYTLSEILKPNPAWATLPLFERTGWKRMTSGEFAESIGERAEPKDAQEEIYVGLEHLDPQCLHIRRWGKGSDVIGGKLRFRKGDIIFGKRRAYQRKLAVVFTTIQKFLPEKGEKMPELSPRRNIMMDITRLRTSLAALADV
jgi:hypothetical protein